MADLGICIAEKLLETIRSDLIKQICDMWGYKSQLNDLKETVTTIQKVLFDADARRELSHEGRDYIDSLKDAVYDADDLFDEFLTLAELKQLRPLSKRGKIYEKVRCFFSSDNQLGQAYRMSRDVKHIKKRLDDIADTHKKFGFSVDYKPIIRRREETCSYVDANKIIGREEDKEAIIEMLLDCNNEEICFTTIVGVGGLGKTALAQLVYDDKRINKEFHENHKFWVCVADQEGEQFDVKTILIKILELVTRQKLDDKSTLQLVQHQFQEKLRGQKYLLVLDDVWNEDCEKWRNLQEFLMLGQGGSRVMVTTRSTWTATIIDGKHVYNLEGLSSDNSWRLFEMSAFGKEIKGEYHADFVEIGKKIVVKCCSNPLALKVAGSLLFGQSISKWHFVEDSEWGKIKKGDNKIMSTLKLSYHNLSPSLKSCFSYCAIFPKGYRIKKQMLFDFWMAHGYIMLSLDGKESLEDVAEEYFAILLRRCFFQDVVKNDYDNVESVKIHDLMHDVAQEVGREEVCVVTCIPNILGNKIRHLRYDGFDCLKSTLGSNKIRSFICRGYGKLVVSDVHTQIENWICLRALELTNLDIVNLPNSLGNLQHLRYLNLSRNRNLELLPDAITRLHNLQTLLLKRCSNLRELPKDFCKLVKLRHLDFLFCNKLISMPSGMKKLTSLQVLPYFVVALMGHKFSKDDGFETLKSFTRIVRNIVIRIGEDYKKEEGINDNKGGHLKSMVHLTVVEIRFEDRCDDHESVLETLEPPSNMKELIINNYNGTKIPKWERVMDNWAFSLPYLVKIKLVFCQNLEVIPVLSKLPLLEKLFLRRLDKLEYMEENTSDKTDSQSTKLFFPSLVDLAIFNLEKLKGWWKEESSSSLNGIDDDNLCCLKRRLRFPRLARLEICNCPNLTSFPSCPTTIEHLVLVKTNERLQVHLDIDDETAGNSKGSFRLWEMQKDNMDYMKSMPPHCLESLLIARDEQVEDNLSESGEVESQVLAKWASSLNILEIHRMSTFRRLFGEIGLHHFTALYRLNLGPLFYKNNTDEEDVFEGCSFPQNLRALHFMNLQKMTSLPQGMQYLTSLRHLCLGSCMNLKALPEWISCLTSLQTFVIRDCPALKSLPEAMAQLTSLQTLTIYGCPELQQRCKEPDGEDRPKIQHIRYIELLD